MSSAPKQAGSQPEHGVERPFVKKTIRAGDGLSLVAEVGGQGDAALVFLHGWCGDREYWKHQVGPFAADCSGLLSSRISCNFRP